MEVKAWTQEELKAQYPLCLIIQDLVKVIEGQAEEEGKVVCTIEVNGLSLSEGDEARFAQTKISEVESFKVSMEDTGRLVADTVISLREGLNGIKNRTVRVADMVRENPAGPAQFEFSGLMEQTKFLTDALGALKPRLRARPAYVQAWKLAENKNKITVNELLAAFKDHDFSLVSDVLEYEMYNLMQTWIDVLDQCEFD